MWSNQYLKEELYLKDSISRKRIGEKYKAIGVIRDKWQADFIENRKFLVKYASIKYEVGSKREKRTLVYQKRYAIGFGLEVEYDVNLSKQHYLNGIIQIGNNVLLAKHVFIDYSGEVKIGDNVQLTNGVIIESHYHPFHSNYSEPRNIVCPTKVEIAEGAVIGSRAIIMPTCHYIGKYARIGAGAVVTKDIPDYAVAVGVPAKVIRVQK